VSGGGTLALKGQVFAVGVRASELPLPRPSSKLANAPVTGVEQPYVRRPRRKMFRQMRCAVPGFAPICCDTNDPDTQVAGLTKRLLRDVPEADRIRLEKFGSFVQAWLETNVQPVERVLSFEDWLASTSYSESRKEELRRVHLSLHGGTPTKKQCSRISSFGKTESYPEYKFLRWINARPDPVKVWMGPLMKSVEEVLFQKDWFIKHVPVSERGSKLALLRNGIARYILTDFTAFESHFVADFMRECECRLYSHALSKACTPGEIKSVVRVLTGKNFLRTRLGVRASVDARRMSGDMCTSLGNGFANLMLALFLADERGIAIRGYVEGDDGIFACERGVLSASDYESLGFTIKLFEVNDPCEMIPLNHTPDAFGTYVGAFCGILSSRSGQIIRDPRSFLSSFGWTSSFVYAGEKLLDQLQRAKALSALYETPACPLVAALARRALYETRAANPRYVNDGYHRPPPDEFSLEPVPIRWDTRELFARQFNIPISAQLEIEKRFSMGKYSVMDLIAVRPDMMHYEARFVESC